MQIGAQRHGRRRRLRDCLTDVVLHDRPVRELLADAVSQLQHPSRPGDYVDWFERHYPAVKDNTVRMHMTGYTANNRNRR